MKSPKKSDGFLKLPHSLLRSPLWRSLSAVDRAVYVDIAGEFNGRNNGEIPYSERYGAGRLHLGRNTVARSLKRLQLRQLIRCTRRGSFSVKTGAAKESLWYLEIMNPLGPLQSPVGPTTEPRTPLPGPTTEPNSRSEEESRYGGYRAKRRENPLYRTPTADRREADLERLADYRRRAKLTGAEQAALARLNGGGITTGVSS
jgi:hypothetical protein